MKGVGDMLVDETWAYLLVLVVPGTEFLVYDDVCDIHDELHEERLAILRWFWRIQ